MWPSKYAEMRFRPPLGSSQRSPDPLVGWRGDTPPQTQSHSAPLVPQFSRIRPSPLGAFGASVWGGGHSHQIFSSGTAPAGVVIHMQKIHKRKGASQHVRSIRLPRVQGKEENEEGYVGQRTAR